MTASLGAGASLKTKRRHAMVGTDNNLAENQTAYRSIVQPHLSHCCLDWNQQMYPCPARTAIDHFNIREEVSDLTYLRSERRPEENQFEMISDQ